MTDNIVTMDIIRRINSTTDSSVRTPNRRKITFFQNIYPFRWLRFPFFVYLCSVKDSLRAGSIQK